MKPLAPNTLLQNRYLIVHLIGKGGMGEVYLAVDQRLGSAVALKRTFFSDDEMLGSAFEREARTLARLRHPVLPKVSDHFTENELQYLVMEHITGDDLSKRLEVTKKPFPLNWVLFWADQLLDALSYLHSHEPPIVHRDIKPQNLKLTDENHIILLDFGLAKNSIGNTKVSSTTGGSIVGYTPHYAPMEQIRGTGTNPRSDIYSFAATFYQLMSNTVPPDALTRADNVLNGMPDPTKPLTEVNPEIPKVISDVILKGMALSMEQRYATARDMQKALREGYAQMQNAMGAQTMAYNMPGNEQSQPVPQSQQQTEQYSGNIMGHVSDDSHQAPTLVSDPFAGRQAENVQASVHPDSYSSQPQTSDAEAKYGGEPIGEKTEVLPKEKMPNLENYAAAVPQETFAAEQVPSVPQNQANFDESVPSMVKFDESQESAPQPTANYNSLPKTQAAAAGANSFPTNQSQPQTATAFTPTAPVQTQPQKKSGGKGLMIAGGLGGLAIVAVGAVGIGWYALRPTEATVNPTPTPVVEATVAPTAEPTIETTTNQTNSSTEVAASTPESTPETTEDAKNQKTLVTTEKTPQQMTTQSTPVRTTATPRVVTAKTPATVKPTPPPAKTPTRTDILQ
jgi:serine/threonine protein kinase